MPTELEAFYGPNAGYVLELYERYQRDPASVDPATRAFFAQWSPNGATEQAIAAPSPAPAGGQPALHAPAGEVAGAVLTTAKVVGATALAHAIRDRGHLGARLDPLGTEPPGDPALLPETYGLTEEDLAALPPIVVGGHAAEGARNALEAINRVRRMYSGTISYEFNQVKSPVERAWLRDAVGLALYQQEPDAREKHDLLERLTEVEVFERYLHQTFPGQKRFSIEGTDLLVPMLDEIICRAVEVGAREVTIGMAHRGRLNVLAHVLEKPYAVILSEFMHLKQQDIEGNPAFTYSGWTGDVKYHLGAERLHRESARQSIKLTLASNPSHLEFINPVVEGMARAAQEDRLQPGKPPQDVNRALPILIHGDAAFPGEGIVAETFNLWRLPGYWTGGTIHIIVDNQVGFTTEARDGRSTHFASDLAKGFEVPIIHVNADDPEACLVAARIAHAWRNEFHKDILIELVGYRRWGHNEGDEPAFTQPRMYEVIRAHPTVRALYAKQIEQQGVITPQAAEEATKAAFERLERAKREAEKSLLEMKADEAGDSNGRYSNPQPAPLTTEQLVRLNEELLQRPENFHPNAKLERLFQRQRAALGAEGGIDWGQAEALAFALLLAEGIPIRLTGQDTERGTFSHRHAVLHDEQTGETFTPLQHLPNAKASFAIYNSPLSEAGVLGFEFGYSMHAPKTLVLWEAQFGDFANAAQVIIDQFIVSARAKWRQEPSLVLLLPHGYEGQGPEHSSARLERYLQLAAEDNIRVANCSTAAQYFHLLRWHAARLEHQPRPLIIMTPKSLLRHPQAAARLDDLAQGTFQPVMDDQTARAHPERISRVVVCSGKVAIDLLTSPERAQAEEVAIGRVELLYPFPQQELTSVLAGYPNARELVWVQEEPENMGAWNLVAPRLQDIAGRNLKVSHISRPERASPAEGVLEAHQAEQQRILSQALHLAIKQRGGRHAS
ncbi:MAG TPA: 2-oxoglutarate dehydrogenase E1 component [Ktedonobacterales bacterium]|jgi:2-oxoglutarate dehydrogenase E1 component